MAKNKLEKRIRELEELVDKLQEENKKLRKGTAPADVAESDDGGLKIGPSEDSDDGALSILRHLGFRKVGKKESKELTAESLDKEVEETRVAREKFALDADTRLRNIAIEDIDNMASAARLSKVEVANLHRKIAVMHPDDVVCLVKDLRNSITRLPGLPRLASITPMRRINHHDFDQLAELPPAR